MPSDYAFACWVRRLAEDRREQWLFALAEALFSNLRMQAAAERCSQRGKNLPSLPPKTGQNQEFLRETGFSPLLIK